MKDLQVRETMIRDRSEICPGEHRELSHLLIWRRGSPELDLTA